MGVLVGNSRKLFSIVTSFLLFPKPLTPGYVLGTLLCLGGLTFAVMLRERKRLRKKVASGTDISAAAGLQGANGSRSPVEYAASREGGTTTTRIHNRV